MTDISKMSHFDRWADTGDTKTTEEGPEQVVCNSCLAVAHQNGIVDLQTQQDLMMLAGREIESHICDAREKPDQNIKCLCGCNSDDDTLPPATWTQAPAGTGHRG